MAASLLGMSRMHLNRKLRALTGQSTHEFIRTMRLETARDLLQKHMPVECIAGSVGFRSSSHFEKVFRERFGAKPSTYRTMKTLAGEAPRTRSSGE
jgi:transcriptional regulator GlxA family with amidase domain